MDDIKKKEYLKNILNTAKHDRKNDYGVYHSYRRLLEDLELNPKDFEKAVRELSKVLGI